MNQSILLKIAADVSSAESGLKSIDNSLGRLSARADSASNSCDLLKKALYAVTGISIGSALLQGLSAIQDAVASIYKTALEYNRTLENTRLGIAGIVYSMASIKDEGGRLLQGQEKFNAATQVAAKTQRDLEKIAMSTAVTYQELVATYQAILAPAFAAKLTMGQTATIAGLLANSVKAMGLPMNQIVQESRDMLSGNIDNNSQLAKSLGISREMVQEWIKKKTLYDEVTKRLEGFVYASREFENTWDGALSNLKDAFQKALGTGLAPLMQPVVDVVKQISAAFVDVERNADGTVKTITVKKTLLTGIYDLLANPLYKAWLAIKGICETIYNLFNMHNGALNIITQSVLILWNALKMVLDGWGWIAAVAMPAVTQGINQINTLFAQLAKMGWEFGNIMVNAMYAVGDSLGKIAQAAWQAVTGDFKGAGATLGEMFKGESVKNMNLWGAELSNTAGQFKSTVNGMKGIWNEFLDKTVEYNKGLNKTPFSNDKTFDVTGNPVSTKTAKKTADEWGQAHDAYIRYTEKFTELQKNTIEQTRNEEIAALKILKEKRLITEVEFLQQRKGLNAKYLNDELNTLERQYLSAEKNRLDAQKAIIDENTGKALNFSDKEALTYHKALTKETEITAKLVALVSKEKITGAKDVLDIEKAITAENSRQLSVAKQLSDAQNANAAFTASQVGTNPLTGEVTDPLANTQAIEEQRMQATFDRINREVEAFRIANESKKNFVNDFAVFGSAKMDEYANEAVKSAQQIAKVQHAESSKAYNDLANMAGKTFPKITGFAKLSAMAQTDYSSKSLNSITGMEQGKMKLAADSAAFIGTSLQDAAAMQDTSSRSGFETAKAMQMSATVVNTAAAVMNQMSMGDPLTAPARAAMAAAMGAAQLAIIASTSFGGGGGGSVGSISGSFGSGGATGTGSAAGVGSMSGTKLMSVLDQKTGPQLDVMVDRMGSASMALGKTADSLYDIAQAFKSGTSNGLIQGAPGRYADVGTAKNGVGGFLGSTTGQVFFMGAVYDFFTGGMFGRGPARTERTGFTLGYDKGAASMQSYADWRAKGGLFQSDKTGTQYSSIDTKFAAGVNAEISTMVASIRRGAIALGQTGKEFDNTLSGITIAATKIKTSGRKDEDIIKDLQAQFTKIGSTIAEKALPQLKYYAQYNETAIDTLVRLSSALTGVNDQFALIGKTLLGDDIFSADVAYRLQELFGGAEKMGDAFDAYFTTMYSDTEQSALKAAAAQRELDRSGLALPDTIEQYRELVDATTDPAMIAALMQLAPAFAEVKKQIKALNDTASDYYTDLQTRELDATGQSGLAAVYQLKIDQEKELKAAIDKGLDTTYLLKVQELEMANAMKDAANDVSDAVQKIRDAAKTTLVDGVNAALTILQAMQKIMTGPAAMLSPEAAYRQAQAQFNTADASNVATRADALLAASKNYNASGAAYQADYQAVLTKMGQMAETVPTLSFVEQQINLLGDIKTAVDKGATDTVAALGITFDAAQIDMGLANNALTQALKAIQGTLNTPITDGTAKTDIQYQIALLQSKLNTSVTGTAKDAISNSIGALQLALNGTISAGTAQSAISTAYSVVQGALNGTINGTTASTAIAAQKTIIQAALNGGIDGTTAKTAIDAQKAIIQAVLNGAISGTTTTTALDVQRQLIQANLNGTISALTANTAIDTQQSLIQANLNGSINAATVNTAIDAQQLLVQANLNGSIDGATAQIEINKQKAIVQGVLNGTISGSAAKTAIESQFSSVQAALNGSLNTGSTSISTLITNFNTSMGTSATTMNSAATKFAGSIDTLTTSLSTMVATILANSTSIKDAASATSNWVQVGNVYGTAGYDTKTIAANEWGGTYQQDIESISLPNPLSSYRLTQAGNTLLAYDAQQRLIAKIIVSATGTRLAFANTSYMAAFDTSGSTPKIMLNGAPLPQFATGTNYLPSDMIAQIHAGERIVPAADNNEIIRRLSVPQNAAADNRTADEVKELKSLVKTLIAVQRDSGNKIIRNQEEGNATLKGLNKGTTLQRMAA